MKTLLLASLAAFAGWCGSSPTPAEFAIQNAQAEIAQHPDYFTSYNHLAMAYARRARETDDMSLFAKAEEAVKKSLALSPENYDARKAGVVVLLGRHEWSAARDSARKLNKQTPDDVAIYGYIVDADVALGDFKDAVEETQWMLNLRPGNEAGLIRAGRLRELYKDYNGALQVLQMAYDATPFAEREERAWVLVQMARVDLESGDSRNAEAAANEALVLFPGYPPARSLQDEIRPPQARQQH
jgi:tetratricopeptide (TPR) repeat protein